MRIFERVGVGNWRPLLSFATLVSCREFSSWFLHND